jgi:L-asparaginase
MTLDKRIRTINERHDRMSSAVVEFPGVDELSPYVRDQLASLDRNGNRSKVLVLYYGGTIGMEYKELEGTKVLAASNDVDKLLRPLRQEGLEDKVQVVWLPVLGKAIDSTNGRWPHWVSIANGIELLYDHFDGFVVAGGTDTMSYLTAAMHFILPNAGKPIIGAASQQPIGEWGEDAVRNLSFAIEAATSDLSGAHLAFYDKLRHGLHLFKVRDKGYDAFDSPDKYLIGEFEQGNVNLFGNQPRRFSAVTKSNLQVNRNFLDGIDITRINPFGYADSLMHMAKNPSTVAILLETYGAGNVRDLRMFEDDPTHVEVIEKLHKSGFPLVLGSPMQDGVVDSPYESGSRAMLAGAISGGNTTGSTLPIKISRALYNAWDRKTGLDYRKFRAEMYRSHVGEFDERIKDRTDGLWFNTKLTRK